MVHDLTTQKGNVLTSDDINDLKVLIVGNLVVEGIIKDCTDTDDYLEFDAQDVVENTLRSRLTQLGFKIEKL